MALALATAQEVPPTGTAALGLQRGIEPRRIDSLAPPCWSPRSWPTGLLMTSVGLALATWIKRQSRAIAAGVGLSVLVAAAWPFLILLLGDRGLIRDAPDMAALSPIFCTAMLAATLAIRDPELRGFLPWAMFWGVQVSLCAVAILWLAVRTFDRCFGRMPERPRTSSRLPLVWKWVVTIAITCATWAFATWGFDILQAVCRDHDEAMRIFNFITLVMVELLVLSLVAVRDTSGAAA